MVAQASASSDSGKTSGTRAKVKIGGRHSRKVTRSAAKPEDAIKFLRSDHKQVKEWFDDFDKADDDRKKEKLARDICRALTIHTQIEDDNFYPAARDADVDADLLDEADIEHASAKHLIAQIKAMDTGAPRFDATVRVLGEYVKHHMAEEENELFVECRESEMDLTALGKKLADRKAQLMAAA